MTLSNLYFIFSMYVCSHNDDDDALLYPLLTEIAINTPFLLPLE